MNREDMLRVFGVVPRSVFIEVKVTDQEGLYTLPNSDILRGKTVVGVLNNPQRQVDDTDTVYTPSNRAVVSETVLNSAALTLWSDSVEFIKRHPLRHITLSDGDRGFTPTQNIRGFNPTESTIEVNNPNVPADKLVVGTSFWLQFLYID
ncbi:MAG: hypothetical protein KDC34_19060 [Saprospiraceae bacterium]|nr:hypothetical protein [Saprospiraceae bacterium]